MAVGWTTRRRESQGAVHGPLAALSLLVLFVPYSWDQGWVATGLVGSSWCETC